jgi:frataxin-like iron-binding protein CyaY
MYKNIKALAFILLIILASPMKAEAAAITPINDLIENAKALDGKEITIQGETIGEELERGNYCWININDGSNAIGIWLDGKSAGFIKFYGDYKHIGDTVQITGVFHRACTQHDGEADIHGSLLTIEKTGYLVKDQVPIIKLIITLILMGVGLSFSVVYFRKIKLRM